MFGKLLGAIVGATIGLAAQSGVAALVLAALGALIGHGVDRRSEEDAGGPSPQAPLGGVPGPPVALPKAQSRAEIDAEARASFARHLCALFVEVARADGELVRDEVRVVRQFFAEELRYEPRELEAVRLALKAALAQPTALEAAAEACLEELTPSARLLLLNALYELALADGGLRRAEREAIHRVARLLGLAEEELRSVAALHLGEGQAHYERLGLTPGATDEELKSAFRRLAALHHPDKVAHLGPGAAEAAARTFRELRAAYEALQKLRGI